jgi:hypothetical protein
MAEFMGHLVALEKPWGIRMGAEYVTSQKYFSHPNLVIYYFFW